MILNEVNFFSETLVSCCTMNVLLPQRALASLNEDNPQSFRVLYLLHGHSDDNTAWMRFSSIESYVEGLNLAVIMPDGQNSFYTDMAHGGKFFTFMTEEVPAVAKSIFPLSSKREDTFIAGPSMGGYGAYKLAFSRPEQYAAAASLSGALDIAAFIQEHRETNDQFRQEIMEGVFGGPGCRLWQFKRPVCPGAESLPIISETQPVPVLRNRRLPLQRQQSLPGLRPNPRFRLHLRGIARRTLLGLLGHDD